MLSASDYLSIVEGGTGEPTEIGIEVLLSGNVSLSCPRSGVSVSMVLVVSLVSVSSLPVLFAHAH